MNIITIYCLSKEQANAITNILGTQKVIDLINSKLAMIDQPTVNFEIECDEGENGAVNQIQVNDDNG
jgi:hypothetical protein